jgi:general stress protein CsbA
MTKREPTPHDLLALARSLADAGVEYALIGGTAMAVHGFSRATKDIDLLLPIDPENNAKLMHALEAVYGDSPALLGLRREWMDKGHSTALEGEIYVDLLYVAASQSFDGLKKYIQTFYLEGIPVVTLDVDGMLLTKKTTRESDTSDRLKLERLRNALRAKTDAQQDSKPNPP